MHEQYKKKAMKRKQIETNLPQVKNNDNEPQEKKQKKTLMKPPTVEELNNLKETENLYNNNLFRLQIDELLKEVSIKSVRKVSFVNWLESLESNQMPELEVQLSKIGEIKRHKFLKKSPCGFETDQDLLLKFSRPDAFECFGMYENNCLPDSNLEIEINCIMPETCLLRKDYLNNRYLVRRFYYLLYLSEHLPGKHKHLVYNEHNILLPILSIQSIDDKFTVKVYVSPPKDYFKSFRYLPNVNNVKKDLYKMNIESNETLSRTPTIFYNTILAHDGTLSINNQFVKSTINQYQNIQDGIKLICIWLRQREMNVGFGGFTENLVLYLVAYLLARKKLNKLMSSYQIVRIFWNFLISNDLETNRISLCDSPKFDAFEKDFPLIFLDRTGYYNLMAFLNVDIYRKVVAECRAAIELLDSNRMESFRLLFLTKFPFHLQYDLLINLTDSLNLLANQLPITDEEKSTYIGYESLIFLTKISDLLRKGLSKRIKMLVPQLKITNESSLKSVKKILFGINLDPETAFNLVELGPDLSDLKNAEEFRQFWGHLSSDRRFKDGSMHVAVHIKAGTVRARRNIIKRILKYLLMEKFQLKFKIYYDEFEKILMNKSIVSPYLIGTNEESCSKIIHIADDLGQKIRSLKMSLTITGIQGLSDAFCYTDACPPIASLHKWNSKKNQVAGHNLLVSLNQSETTTIFIQPIKLVLHLEHSSKWPNTLDGVRHIKTSFYLEIARHLNESHDVTAHVTKHYLEVFYEGLVFRYFLYVPKEIALMKQNLTEDGGGFIQSIETEASLEYEKQLNVLPKINGALKGLHVQYPSYGPSTALIKRWFRSLLYDEYHMPDVVINLLNASLYLNHSDFVNSCTPQIAFLRFLKFLAEFEWQLQPVLVNFNEEIPKEDILDLESRFQENRNHIQPLYIIIPFDKGQSLFTKSSPTKESLIHAQRLAKATLEIYEIQIEENKELIQIEDLFTPNLAGYDLIIYLKPLTNLRRYESIEKSDDDELKLRKYFHNKNEKIPLVGFNYVDSYLKYLRENYGDFAVFFHNSYGGNVIGVLWRPNIMDSKPFKVSNINGRKQVENYLVFNPDAIINDFHLIGGDLIERIEELN